jgi:hypothetical protein
VPLIVAALMTFEICGLTGFELNYANIIALPVLLGVAVLTTVAFGSLWFSVHPGTSSMGKLLALSFACTLASALLFQPALMGEPRKKPQTNPETEALARRA